MYRTGTAACLSGTPKTEAATARAAHVLPEHMGRTNHQLGLFSNEATFHQIQSLSDAQVADKGLLVHLPDSPGYQSCKAYAGFFFSFLFVSCCQWCPEVKDEHSLPKGRYSTCKV